MITQANRTDQASHIHRMFRRISSRYDLMNRLLTFGRDLSWRRYLITMAKLPKGGRLLDVGTGTGDIAFEALRLDPTIRITAVDFTLEMMEKGRDRDDAKSVGWCKANASRLPFHDNVFDAVASGFLIRNVNDVKSIFKEQMRVVKPGGCVVCLDTSPVPPNIIKPFVMFYLKRFIPFLGYMITGEKDAYTYLSTSTINFMKAEETAGLMEEAGLENVTFRRFMFGNIAVHKGLRPGLPSTTPVSPGLVF
jgi:demethylmenaquinone methyltransferase/2-methoxy-6-polyprenyl-1,4-benzoquinol methylase